MNGLLSSVTQQPSAEDPLPRDPFPDEDLLDCLREAGLAQGPADAELAGLLAPDLDSDPPDGADAWLAMLPWPLLEEHLDSTAPARLQVYPAGFLPRDTGSGPGFAAGGAMDTLPPGPVLAQFSSGAAAAGLDRLSDDELIGVLAAWRRLVSWATAGELSAVTELTARRGRQAMSSRDSSLIEHLPDELAAALTLTMRSAHGLLSFAHALSRLPRTADALATGRIDRDKAFVIADELASLDEAAAAAVEGTIIGHAPGQTTGQLRAAVKRAVLAADPAAADRRRREAQREARVETWTEHGGTAALAGRDLPPAEVLAADKRIDALARALKADGASGTLDQLRARVYTALLLGQPIESLLPGRTAQPPVSSGGQAGPGGTLLAEATGLTDPDLTTASSLGGTGLAGTGLAGTGLAGTGLAGTGLAGTGLAGTGLAGTGLAGTGLAGTGLAGTGLAGTGLAGTGLAGTGLAGTGLAGTGLAGTGLAGTGLAGTGLAGTGLTGTGLTGRINLVMPLATWLGAGQAPGEVPGFGAVDAGTCRTLGAALAAQQDSRWCLTLTDAAGRAVGHGCASRAPAGSGWAVTIKIADLAPGECGHHDQSAAYRPPARMRHLIETRNRTCTFPSCRQPATRCDLDHTQAYDDGGRTCGCNLAPLCRRHHQAKQARGWQLEQPEPGVLSWALPHGRRYPAEPEPYPI